MDVPFHALAGLVISKKVTGEYLVLTSLFSTLPDLIGGVSFQLSKARHVKKYPVKEYYRQWMKVTRRGDYFTSLDRVSFRVTHSLFFLFPISLASFIIWKDRWWILTFCYFLHLLVDLVTHGGKRAHQPFYPLVKYKVQGKFYEEHKYIFAAFWIILLLTYSF